MNSIILNALNIKLISSSISLFCENFEIITWNNILTKTKIFLKRLKVTPVNTFPVFSVLNSNALFIMAVKFTFNYYNECLVNMLIDLSI